MGSYSIDMICQKIECKTWIEWVIVIKEDDKQNQNVSNAVGGTDWLLIYNSKTINWDGSHSHLVLLFQYEILMDDDQVQQPVGALFSFHNTKVVNSGFPMGRPCHVTTHNLCFITLDF